MAEHGSSRFCEEIVRHLSADRMRPYLSASGDDLERALCLYRWNVKVSAAFFELLASVEVVTRNALREQLVIWNAQLAFGDTWLSNRTAISTRKPSQSSVRQKRGLSRQGLSGTKPRC